MKWLLFAFAMLGVAATDAAGCTQDDYTVGADAFKTMKSQCSTKFMVDIYAYEYATDKTAWMKNMCNDTKCVAATMAYTTSMPNCTIVDKLYEGGFRTTLTTVQARCKTLAAGGDVATITMPPPSAAPAPQRDECSANQLTYAYDQEKQVKDACGAVFSMAATVLNDPQGAGAKICSNTKCWNALDSLVGGSDCLVDGLGFRNTYKRQFASAQLACKKALGKDVNKVADACDQDMIRFQKFSAEQFAKSGCAYATQVAWYPQNDTAATTKLCKDTACLTSLEYDWMNKYDCVWGDKNQQVYYRNQTSPIMEECAALGFKLEHPNGLPAKIGTSSSSVRYAPATVMAAVFVAVALVHH